MHPSSIRILAQVHHRERASQFELSVSRGQSLQAALHDTKHGYAEVVWQSFPVVRPAHKDTI